MSKTNKLYVCLLLIFLLVIIIIVNVEVEKKTVEYKFPITPQDKEWKNYSRVSLEKLLNIPEDIIDSLSTNQLIQLVLDYPYDVHFFCFNTPRAGFLAVFDRFNGLSELLNREDCAQKLFNRYKQTAFNKESDFELINDVKIMELILNQPELKEHLTVEESYLVDCFLADSCLHTIMYKRIDEPKIVVEYDYPIKPGTDEWFSLKGHTAREEMCQIPVEILKKLNTKQLVNLALEHPFYGAMYLYLPVQKGFNVIHNRYNVIEELLNRKDVGKYLLEKYKATSVKQKADLGEYIDLNDIEILLAQKEIQNNLTKEQLKELNQLVEQKKAVKVHYSDTYRSSYYHSIIESNWSTEILITEE